MSGWLLFCVRFPRVGVWFGSGWELGLGGRLRFSLGSRM